jgi:uncharacterized C2H2 Zn-finger protein
MYGDRCNSCGKQFIRKKKQEKYVRKLTLPQWGFSTPLSGEMAKKKDVLRNEKQSVYVVK